MTIVDDGAAEGPEEAAGIRAQESAAPPRPWIRRNDYTDLQVPALGAWEPRLDVSVVVPAHGHQDKLDLVLAALAAQSYPGHLMEVVVVDDGSTPPLRMPEVRPENARLITADDGGWGSAHAVNCGVAASEGAVVLRLDADMLVYRDHVESQLRWHHLADYAAVLGHKLFVPFTPGEPSAEEVHAAVAAGRTADLFDAAAAERHWIERIIDRTEALTAADHLAYRVFIGATGSLHRTLFDEAGGLAGELVLGGDSEFAYRLAQTGAVFVPDSESSSWHLGRTQMQTRREAGARYRHPYVAARVPDFENRRKQGPRQWMVPYVDVVVDVTGVSLEDADTTVAALLGGGTADVRVTLLGPWSKLTEERRSPLEEELLDLRLIRETFRGESRVVFADAEPQRDPNVPFRLVMPAGVHPTRSFLERITQAANRNSAGLLRVTAPGVAAHGPGSMRLERTAAFARARRLGAGGEGLDDAIDRLWGQHWIGGQGLFVEGEDDADAVPHDWRGRLRKAEEEAAAQRARADRLERRLRWLGRGLPRRLADRLTR
ncbi:glycosyltransferase [Streptomonospora litoralis]|uniref:N-glycosyltransferase n=1 Tax=Streptomonospora litoralis TaxID=2498135 RepID=A0A4P6Q469_9ACTN|nr:glycosyltransferase family 2 protein [Streptomonospora litoralis]QBI53709.1 N-glycosyltransferase [Streptomonospora litoralis]